MDRYASSADLVSRMSEAQAPARAAPSRAVEPVGHAARGSIGYYSEGRSTRGIVLWEWSGVIEVEREVISKVK